MSSVADVVNLALAHLAEKANVVSITPPDNTQNAQYAARFYPIARDALLERHDWGFNTKRDVLALVDLGDAQPTAWTYAYTLPNLCARPMRVLLPETTDDNQGENFKVETHTDGSKVIYTNAQDAVLVYRALVTDSSKFSPLFVLSLSRLLAYYLAGPITKSKEIMQAMWQSFVVENSWAQVSDANGRQSEPYTDYNTGSVASRA